MTSMSNAELTDALFALHPLDMVAVVLSYMETLVPDDVKDFYNEDFPCLLAAQSALESIEANHTDFYA